MLHFWTIITPPGWSCLFVSPLNRPNGLFEVIAGIVDTDTYPVPVNFPGMVLGDGEAEIVPGQPLERPGDDAPPALRLKPFFGPFDGPSHDHQPVPGPGQGDIEQAQGLGVRPGRASLAGRLRGGH